MGDAIIRAILLISLGFILILEALDGSIGIFFNTQLPWVLPGIYVIGAVFFLLGLAHAVIAWRASPNRPRIGWRVALAGLVAVVGAVVVTHHLPLLGGVVLAVLAVPVANRLGMAGEPGRDHAHFSWSLFAVALPIVLATLVPSQPIGNTTLAAKPRLDGPIGSPYWAPGPPDNTQEWDLLTWDNFLNASAPEQATAMLEKSVTIQGFVHHESDTPTEVFHVVRYVTTCCVADSLPVWLPVDYAGASLEVDNTWVRVDGLLERIDYNGTKVIGVRAIDVLVLPNPPLPYIYR